MFRAKKYLPVIIGVLLFAVMIVTGFTTENGFRAVETAQPQPGLRETAKDNAHAKEIAWEELAQDGLVEVLIMLREQADTEAAALEVKRKKTLSRGHIPGHREIKDEIAIAVVETLQMTAFRSQGPLIRYLEDEKFAGRVDEFKSFYIVNIVFARVAVELVAEIAARPEVDSVRPNEQVQLIASLEEADVLQSTAIEWNITRIKAPDVWAAGLDGSGVVVGIIDTGVDLHHVALLHKYRGYNPANPGNPSHAYNWFDPYYNKPAPDDIKGHGTPCIGAVLGSDLNAANIIGVAPGAKWIAARGLDNHGTGTEAFLLAAGQYLLAPTPNPDGSGRPDPTKAPDIITNSWGGEAGFDEWFRLMVQSWREAGIMPVFAAGNTGPGYGTINVPSNYPDSFAVAATDSSNSLAAFSSRGPAPYQYPNHMQPNISAPGVRIRSAMPGGSYKSLSGTSMAAPHIAGVAALLLQSNPNLTVAQIENKIMNSAEPLTDSNYPDSPNYGYGYGLVNALAAINADQTPPTPPPLPETPDDTAYIWINITNNPLIPKGPATITVPDGSLGVVKANGGISMLGGDFIGNTWYTVGDDNAIYTVNTSTGDHNLIGVNMIDKSITGLAYDPVGEKLYASAYDENDKSYLYTIDQKTGLATLVGPVRGADQIIFAIAVGENGVLYGCEMTWPSDTANLYAINKANGSAVLIGPLGFDAWGEDQDIAYDRDNGILYGILFDFDLDSGGLYRLNTSTGDAALLQDLAVVAGGFAIPYDQEALLFVGSYPSGTWYLDGGRWVRFSAAAASAMAYGDLTGDGNQNFIASYPSGTWYREGGRWEFLSASTALAMTFADMTGDGSLNFVGSYPSGTWYRDGGRWEFLSAAAANAITYGDLTGDGNQNFIASYPSGTWYREGGRWERLSTSTALAMTFADMTGDGSLNFVGSYPSGIWYRDGGRWVRFSATAANAITYGDITGDGNKNFVFSYPTGTWYLDGRRWMKLSESTAISIVFALINHN